MKQLIFITFIFFTSISIANERPHLEDYLQEQIENFESFEISDDTNQAWDLSKIRVRIRAKGAVTVPYLAKLEIIPFVELHFK